MTDIKLSWCRYLDFVRLFAYHLCSSVHLLKIKYQTSPMANTSWYNHTRRVHAHVPICTHTAIIEILELMFNLSYICYVAQDRYRMTKFRARVMQQLQQMKSEVRISLMHVYVYALDRTWDLISLIKLIRLKLLVKTNSERCLVF